MSCVCILDYGSGNVKSVFNLFAAIADRVLVSNNPDDIESATHIVLPGVGAFGAAMRKMSEALPLDFLERVVLRRRRPFLGICVGMQVLATRGLEFGDFEGLGWIDGSVEPLHCPHQPLPHVGWNNATPSRPSPLFSCSDTDPDFYFVHSYAMRPADPGAVTATTHYGEEFCCAIQQDNLFGVQFHPEKSQRAGVELAKRFVAYS